MEKACGCSCARMAFSATVALGVWGLESLSTCSWSWEAGRLSGVFGCRPHLPFGGPTATCKQMY